MTDLTDFDGFVATGAAPLKRAAYLLTGSQQSAEDLVQATLLRIFERWDQSPQWDSPIAYARTTLFSIFVSWTRRQRLREVPLLVLPEDSVASHEAAVDTAVVVLSALRTLPPRQRAVVVLRYYEGLDSEAIDLIMKCSPVTVRTQLSRALAKLRINDDIGTLFESERT